MNESRVGRDRPISSAPTDAATAAAVTWPLSARRLRSGLQRAIGRQQVPSGSGPVAHGPPQSGGRVQAHVPFVSPGFVDRRGAHSAVARHSPVGLGPTRQGHPSRAFPQTHFLFGRS
jgi:hypothetical protein